MAAVFSRPDRKKSKSDAGEKRFGIYHIIAMVLLIAGYLFLVRAQTMESIDANFKGIIAQSQLLIAIVLILKLQLPGKITAYILSLISIQTVAVGHFILKVPGALTGVFVSFVSLFIIILINHLFKVKRKQYEQLAEQKKTTDTLYNELKKSEELLQQLNADLLRSNEELAKSRKNLHMLAYYDVLTGLPNRALLLETIDEHIEKCKQNIIEGFSIIFLDLDDFKSINDSLGHQEGDEYLRLIGSRLSAITEEADMCGRLSGDEFCIISQKHDDLADLAGYCERFRTVVSRKAVLAGNIISSGTSIGVARYPQNGTSVREILTSADMSMYTAKKRGKNSVYLPGYSS